MMNLLKSEKKLKVPCVAVALLPSFVAKNIVINFKSRGSAVR